MYRLARGWHDKKANLTTPQKNDWYQKSGTSKTQPRGKILEIHEFQVYTIEIFQKISGWSWITQKKPMRFRLGWGLTARQWCKTCYPFDIPKTRLQKSPRPQKKNCWSSLMLQVPHEVRCLGTLSTHSKTTTAEGSSEHMGSWDANAVFVEVLSCVETLGQQDS